MIMRGRSDKEIILFPPDMQSGNRFAIENRKRSPNFYANGMLVLKQDHDTYTRLSSKQVSRTLQFSGKLERQGVAATYASPSNSRRLFVRDRKSNVNFLIDTGSDCSLIPASGSDKLSVPMQTFLAANDTTINVYKQKLLSLDLGLRKKLVYPFYVCNVQTAIIGADFLHYFNLQPDLRNRRLNDTCKNLNAYGILNKADIYSVKSIFCDDDFSKLLNDFSNIVKAPCANQIVEHSVSIILKLLVFLFLRNRVGLRPIA
ncbi:hypothetical protein AVEN_155272-1 [Araneus ventricosus]|uniref:Peptidase A2 domain-containing protein n=1 Tax=Araneus ventricosus TaxID=182803 RepID=A0A4Y2D7P1_ARAVE|nr:hypothetical protein AVEN_155272-1 [Araneus ventricosus]